MVFTAGVLPIWAIKFGAPYMIRSCQMSWCVGLDLDLPRKTMSGTTMSAVDLIDDAIAELEARLNLKPGQDLPATSNPAKEGNDNSKQSSKKAGKKSKEGAAEKKADNDNKKKATTTSSNVDDLPVICKMEFKVGVITKVWVHEKADKLYCEEIDCGEATGPRQIASGLRPFFTLEQMLGQRLLVVSNLKAKNLVGFKSHGMVLCAAAPNADDGSERVEFVEPPADAPVGEIVTFEGLPPPQPAAPSQVDKNKIFQACAAGLQTTAERVATWNGHAFMTSAGPCTAKTIAGGVLR
jgi:aminoacyl tRNA synthase complex-interacting multifunctional protein 1